MSWDWLKDGVGGGVDFLTGGFTDFDGRGKGKWNLVAPAGDSPTWGGSSQSSGFDLNDAMTAFTRGYSTTMGAMGGMTPGGSSFLNAYTSGKGATPTSTSPISTSSAFTAGGGTHSMPGIVIDKPVDFYAFKDNVQYPTQEGSGGSSKSGGLLDTAGKALGLAAAAKAAFPLTFAALCDIRTKTDISPLKTTEVNDDLAQVAFFVKELRECS